MMWLAKKQQLLVLARMWGQYVCVHAFVCVQHVCRVVLFLSWSIFVPVVFWHWCYFKLSIFSRTPPQPSCGYQARSWMPGVACTLLSAIKHNLLIPFMKFILLQHLLDLFSTFTSYSIYNPQNAWSQKTFLYFQYKKLYGNSNLQAEYWTPWVISIVYDKSGMGYLEFGISQ